MPLRYRWLFIDSYAMLRFDTMLTVYAAAFVAVAFMLFRRLRHADSLFRHAILLPLMPILRRCFLACRLLPLMLIIAALLARCC